MHVHGRTGKPKQLARYAKDPWKTGFCSGEDGNRTFGCFPNGFGRFERCFLETGILPKIRLVGVLPALTRCGRGCVCSALDHLTFHRNRFCQARIWYSFRSRYRPDTRCLLTLPCGLGDCMNVASRLLRHPFADSSDLGNNWIGHFNSPSNQMVYRSMAVPCLSLDTPARSLGGAQGMRCTCSSC